MCVTGCEFVCTECINIRVYVFECENGVISSRDRRGRVVSFWITDQRRFVEEPSEITILKSKMGTGLNRFVKSDCNSNRPMSF